MTIDEAIQVNTAVQNYEMPCWVPKAFEAYELGNEALKYIRSQDNCPGVNLRLLLPGETEE